MKAHRISQLAKGQLLWPRHWPLIQVRATEARMARSSLLSILVLEIASQGRHKTFWPTRIDCLRHGAELLDSMRVWFQYPVATKSWLLRVTGLYRGTLIDSDDSPGHRLIAK